MGLKEIKGDWREDDLAVLAMVAEREKSLYQLKNKADNNNHGQRGQSRGNGRNEGEREKREKPRTNDTASIRASYSSILTSQRLCIPDKAMTSPYSCLSSFNLAMFHF